MWQEALGSSSAEVSAASRALRASSDLLAPLQKKLKAALDERAKCKQVREEVMEEAREVRKGPLLDDMDKKPRDLQNLVQYGRAKDAELMVRRIEEEFETSVMGADDRYSVLGDKPNISKTGLKKVTNDQTALLRAERQTIRRVAEIKKTVPVLEQHEELRQGVKDKQDEVFEKVRTLDQELAAVRGAMATLYAESEGLRKEEYQKKQAYDAVVERRTVLRSKVQALRVDIKAELAERNKQRERYRYVVAQEREMALRHELRQAVISNAKEEELKQLQEATEEAALAKEEAEAHARMLQASIARYSDRKSVV